MAAGEGEFRSGVKSEPVVAQSQGEVRKAARRSLNPFFVRRHPLDQGGHYLPEIAVIARPVAALPGK